MEFREPPTTFKLNWLKVSFSGEKLHFDGIGSHSDKTIEVNVFAKFDRHESTLAVTSFVKDSLSFGSKTLDVPLLWNKFMHLQPIKHFVN